MTRRMLIYGAGGSGRELAYSMAIDKNPDTTWKIDGFVDDTEDLWGQSVNGIPVVGGYDYLKNYAGNLAVCIVADPLIKRNLVTKIKQNSGIKFPFITSSHAKISEYIEWGEGCIASQSGIAIGPNIKIGDFVFINAGTIIGHDTNIGNYTALYAGVIISGRVSIGSDCVIGSGVIVLPNLKIGDGSVIAAGSLVTKDIPPNAVAAGMPARVVKSIERTERGANELKRQTTSS